MSFGNINGHVKKIVNDRNVQFSPRNRKTRKYENSIRSGTNNFINCRKDVRGLQSMFIDERADEKQNTGLCPCSTYTTQLSGELLQAVLKNNIPNRSSSEGTEISTDGTFANWILIIFQLNSNGMSLDCSVCRAKFIDAQIKRKKKNTDIKVVKLRISKANILISLVDISQKFETLQLCIWKFDTLQSNNRKFDTLQLNT